MMVDVDELERVIAGSDADVIPTPRSLLNRLIRDARAGAVAQAELARANVFDQVVVAIAGEGWGGLKA